MDLYNWDFDCLLSVIEYVIDNLKKYPDKNDSGYIALKKLYEHLRFVMKPWKKVDKTAEIKRAA